jgi:hypothetical protein
MGTVRTTRRWVAIQEQQTKSPTATRPVTIKTAPTASPAQASVDGSGAAYG